MRVLTVVPHPDDESIGCGATLLALRESGHSVTVFACSLGRSDQQARRLRELAEACNRGEFDLIVGDPPVGISSSDDLITAEARLTSIIRAVVEDLDPLIVLSPHLHDVHPGHEVVARATRRALEGASPTPVWWQWPIWADLAIPTLYVPFNDSRLQRVLELVDAYSGENARNDYRQFARGRSMLYAVLGTERVFGFGTPSVSAEPYAELLTELVLESEEWLLGVPRLFDPSSLFHPPTRVSMNSLLDRPSYAAQLFTSFRKYGKTYG